MAARRCFPHPWVPQDVAAVQNFSDQEAVRSLLRGLVQEVEDGSHPEDFSIYTGRLGIAYMYLLLAKNPIAAGILSDQRSLRSLAQRWFEDASARKPFYRGGISFVLGASGVHVLGCLLDDKWADWHGSSLAALHRVALRTSGGNLLRRWNPATFDILSMTSFLSWAPASELLFGQAGWLFAALHANALLEAEGRTPAVPEDVISEVAEALLEEGRRHPRTESSESSPLCYSCFGEEYLGAAHGLMGICYVLLHTPRHDAQEIRDAVDFVIAQQGRSGNFPAVLGENADSALVHWCHGAPGAVFLLCRAYELFADDKYISAALAAGECVWEFGLLRKGTSLCHGVAGNGYALLRLWRATGDEKWLARAQKFGLFCTERLSLAAQHQMRTPDNPLSMFEGIAGAACFVADLLQPQDARFPGFELS